MMEGGGGGGWSDEKKKERRRCRNESGQRSRQPHFQNVSQLKPTQSPLGYVHMQLWCAGCGGWVDGPVFAFSMSRFTVPSHTGGRCLAKTHWTHRNEMFMFEVCLATYCY